MDSTLAKIGKIAVGVVGALMVGEITAIGANAAIDDLKVVGSQLKGYINPEPVKPKRFGRIK